MDNKQVIIILVIIKATILGCVSVGACLYAIPLCLIRRFHTPIHLLTLNVCIAAFICASFWSIYFIMNTFYIDILWSEQSCLPILYIQTTVVCQVLYALCMVSLNRLFTVLFQNKALFRTKRWVTICISIQWIFAASLPLPSFASSLTHCLITGLELHYQLYILVIIGVIPAVALAVINSIIFIYARRSSRRVQPIHGENAPAPALSPRDARLLKHMIFIFAVFFCGWIPVYIVAVIDWDGTQIPYVALHASQLLPVMSLLIDVVDLFWYNHELRSYLANPLNNRVITRADTRPTTRPN